MVSVKDTEELQLTIESGQRWIDLKDPSVGALQPTAIELWNDAAKRNIPQLSVAMGELFGCHHSVEALPRQGVDFAKVGLANMQDSPQAIEQWLSWATAVRDVCRPVIVGYADWQTCGTLPPMRLLDLARQGPFAAFLIDTFDKTRGDLFRHLEPTELWQLLSRARNLGLTTVVGGSLAAERPAHEAGQGSIFGAMACNPDVVAVRGAICESKRDATICPRLLSRVQEIVLETSRQARHETVPTVS